MVSQQLLLDVVGIVFVDVHNNQAGRLVSGNLSAKLAADGTTAARYQHASSLYIA